MKSKWRQFSAVSRYLGNIQISFEGRILNQENHLWFMSLKSIFGLHLGNQKNSLLVNYQYA